MKMKQSFCLPIVLVLLAFYPAPSYEQAETSIEDLKCGDGSNIEFALIIPDIADWSDADAASWSLKVGTAGCQPSFTDDKVKYGPFDGSICHSSLDAQSNDKIIYTFSVDVTADGSGPTFRLDHSYQILCTYNLQRENLQASFLPQHSVTGSGEDAGELSFTFELFNGATKIDPGSTTAIKLRTDLTGKLTVSESGFLASKFTVFFVSVKADKDNPSNPAAPTTLITNGCADDGLQSVGFVEDPSSCDGDNEDEFSFKAFRFSGQTGKVVFTVTAKVCYNGSPGCMCACGARKRRSTLEETSKTLYYIRAGPFTFVDASEEEKPANTVVDEDKDSSVPVHIVTVGVVGGVVANAIVCVAVIIVLRKRRRKVILTESRGTQEFATPGV